MFYKTYYGEGHKLAQLLTVSGLQKPSLTHERFISMEIGIDEMMLFSSKDIFVMNDNTNHSWGVQNNAESSGMLWSVLEHSRVS